MMGERIPVMIIGLKKAEWLCLVALVACPLHAGYCQGSSAPVVQATNHTGQTQGNFPANVAAVVKLSSAGLGDEVVLAYIKNSPTSYRLSADDILHLKDAGVSSPVIAAMLGHAGSQGSQNPAGPTDNDQRLYAPANPPPQPEYPISAAQAPPPAQVEVVPAPPGPDYYWIPGYWGWDGGWIWIGGSWGFRGGFWGGYPGGWGGYRGGWGGHYGGGFGGHGGGFGGHRGGGGGRR